MTKILPNQFKDDKDRIWTCNISVGVAIALRDNLSLDIATLTEHSTEGFLQRLLSDSWLLIDALLLVTASQRDERSIDSNGFLSAIGGDVLDAATMAFLEGVTDSLPKLKRRPLKKVLANMAATMETAATKLETATEAKLATMETEIGDAIDAAITGNSSTN